MPCGTPVTPNRKIEKNLRRRRKVLIEERFPFSWLANTIEQVGRCDVNMYLASDLDVDPMHFDAIKSPAFMEVRFDEMVRQERKEGVLETFFRPRFVIILKDEYKTTILGKIFVAHEIGHIVCHLAAMPQDEESLYQFLKWRDPDGLGVFNFNAEEEQEAFRFAFEMLTLTSGSFEASEIEEQIARIADDVPPLIFNEMEQAIEWFKRRENELPSREESSDSVLDARRLLNAFAE